MNVKLRNDRKEDVTHSRLEVDYLNGDIFACDFYVPDIEKKGDEVIGGYKWGRVINVDHHAPTKKMKRRVSSAILAIERIKTIGRPSGTTNIVINHTDCDSVLTAGIMAGELEPEARFGEAAVAADHTGAENPIADLLQALRHYRDYEFSLHNLKLMLAGQPLEKAAQNDLDERRNKRNSARQSINGFKIIGQVAYQEFKEDVDGELYISILPNAVVILLAVPSKKGLNPHDIKLWLGNAAPEDFSLQALKLSGYDHGYGGRWNAGSNRRNGGTNIPVNKYAKEVARRVDAVLQSLSS